MWATWAVWRPATTDGGQGGLELSLAFGLARSFGSGYLGF
jgi:hypothetical protein